MKIILSNNLTVLHPTSDFREYWSKKLTINNPEYIKKIRMGLSVYNTPQSLCLFSDLGDRLIFPAGIVSYLEKELRNTIYEEEKALHPEIFPSKLNGITLRDYQAPAVISAITNKNGVIVAPCGAGKTVIGLEIIRKLGLRALWLTHTADLLGQAKRKCKEFMPDLQEKTGEIGTITAGKVKLGTHLTFATVQTMHNINLAELKDEFDVIIVDECHRVSGTPTKVRMFYKVINSLYARYKIGITATPNRTDGLSICMFSILGKIIYEIKEKEIEGNMADVFCEQAFTNYVSSSFTLNYDGTLNYNNLLDEIINDKERNEQIVNEIKRAPKPMLVLSERVAHGKILKDLCGDYFKTAHIDAKKKKGREDVLKDLNAGDIDIVFATYQLAKEGLDIPNLATIIFATPQKNKITTEQAAGRVARKGPKKDVGLIIDIVDYKDPMLSKWARQRKGQFKNKGYNV